MTRRAPFSAIACALLASVLSAQQPSPPEPGPAREAQWWNEAFGQKTVPYRTEPNRFLEQALDRLAREGWLEGKRALDVAMGDGRNALLLAERGFTVTGIDISTVALAKARASAKARNLKLDAREADAFTFDYGVERWDLIAIVYFNPAMQVLPTLKKAVRPGGVIVIEGQGSEHQGFGPPPGCADPRRARDGTQARAVSDHCTWKVISFSVFPELSSTVTRHSPARPSVLLAHVRQGLPPMSSEMLSAWPSTLQVTFTGPLAPVTRSQR
jgi:SAM-dependent methyltransferase